MVATYGDLLRSLERDNPQVNRVILDKAAKVFLGQEAGLERPLELKRSAPLREDTIRLVRQRVLSAVSSEQE